MGRHLCRRTPASHDSGLNITPSHSGSHHRFILCKPQPLRPSTFGFIFILPLSFFSISSSSIYYLFVTAPFGDTILLQSHPKNTAGNTELRRGNQQHSFLKSHHLKQLMHQPHLTPEKQQLPLLSLVLAQLLRGGAASPTSLPNSPRNDIYLQTAHTGRCSSASLSNDSHQRVHFILNDFAPILRFKE